MGPLGRGVKLGRQSPEGGAKGGIDVARHCGSRVVATVARRHVGLDPCVIASHRPHGYPRPPWAAHYQRDRDFEMTHFHKK